MKAAAQARRPDPANEPTTQEFHPVVLLRPKELRRLFWRRHGRTLPSDEIGRRDADIMLDHLAQGAAAYRQSTVFLNRRCPWMPPAERLAAIESARQRRKFWTPSALGDALGLTWEERDACRIVTFRPAGVSDAELLARRRQKEAAAKQANRDCERLHPEPKPSKPARRLAAISEILSRSDDWVSVAVVCAEVKRRRLIHFASLADDKVLNAAVHDAINLGITKGELEKRFVPGPRPAISVAQIRRRTA
jgi:hypothetical protein